MHSTAINFELFLWSHSLFLKNAFFIYEWQRRNEVRWHPGQNASLPPPCSGLRSFGSKCSLEVLVILLGLFGAPAVIRRLGDCVPLAPSRYASVALSIIAVDF